MEVEMVMPQMGESIAEASISKWLKKPGDPVKKDEIILEISTDKVDSEIPAPASGVLKEVFYNEGDTVPVKERIAVIETDMEAVQTSSKALAKKPEKEEKKEVSNFQEKEVKRSLPAPERKEPTNAGGAKFISPVVRTLAHKHGVSEEELLGVRGTGSGGRVTKQDFLAYLETRERTGGETKDREAQVSLKAEKPEPMATRPNKEESSDRSELPSLDWQFDGTKVVPMDNMRRLIAEHMVRSKRTSPHVYSVQEVDVSGIAKWRAKYKEEFKKREGFNLSFTPFFLEAAVKALLEFPYLNASVEGNKIILKRNINLGCAVALGTSGLIVPVIKKAEEKNLVGLARALYDLAVRARNKKLLPDEVMGGTFTVTNPGVFGTMIGTPIINQPQVAILCLGQIKKRPVVINDMIAIREICYITLSYDHRIIDGALGGTFLKFIREYLEGWDQERTLY